MIKQALTYFFALGIAISSVNPAIAAQKKKSNDIIKKAVIAYIAYKVYDHYSEKKEDKAKGKPKEKYIEPVYYDECEDEDECEEE